VTFTSAFLSIKKVELFVLSFSICSDVVAEFLEMEACDKSDIFFQKPLPDTTDLTLVYEFVFKA